MNYFHLYRELAKIEKQYDKDYLNIYNIYIVVYSTC